MGLFLVFRGHIYLSGLLFLVSTFVDLAFFWSFLLHSILFCIFQLCLWASRVGHYHNTTENTDCYLNCIDVYRSLATFMDSFDVEFPHLYHHSSTRRATKDSLLT